VERGEIAKVDEEMRVAEEEKDERMMAAVGAEGGGEKLTAMSREHAKLAKKLERAVTDEYITKACKEAENKIRREYRIQETITNRWNQLTIKTLFRHWAAWAEDRITRRIEDVRKQLERRQLEEAARAAADMVAQEEIVKWEEKFDEYVGNFGNIHSHLLARVHI